MKRMWTSEELLEHFTLLPDELDAVGNKSGVTRLEFAVLFKCFQYEGRFLRSRQEAAPEVVRYLSTQVGVDSALFAQYAWEGRTIEVHRAQIRYQHVNPYGRFTLDMTERIPLAQTTIA